jgi:hypothetical protein
VNVRERQEVEEKQKNGGVDPEVSADFVGEDRTPPSIAMLSL